MFKSKQNAKICKDTLTSGQKTFIGVIHGKCYFLTAETETGPGSHTVHGKFVIPVKSIQNVSEERACGREVALQKR